MFNEFQYLGLGFRYATLPVQHAQIYHTFYSIPLDSNFSSLSQTTDRKEDTRDAESKHCPETSTIAFQKSCVAPFNAGTVLWRPMA